MRLAFSRAASRLLAAAFALTFAGVGVASAATPDLWDGNWHYTITPYGWLPGMSLTTRYQLPTGKVENKTNNSVFSYLSGALMIAGEARKGNWGAFADVDWVDFSNEKGRITSVGGQHVGADAELDTRWSLKGNLVTVAGLYSLAHGSHGYMDLLFGARYLNVRGDLRWNAKVEGTGGEFGIADSGSASGHAHFTNALVGLKGAWTPFHDSRFFFPYYADIGTGDSVTSYLLMAGVAYGYDWGNIALRYRELQYKGNHGDKFLKKARMSGPTISATWVF